MNLAGPTPDPSTKYDHILVGQKCTGILNGVPSTLASITKYNWSVDGQIFQRWNVAPDQSSANPIYGIGAADQVSPSWYWSDKQLVQTVFCRATVTPPTGQGSPFIIYEKRDVTLDVPTFMCSEPTGAVQVNANYPPIDNSSPGVYCLWAGPGPNRTPPNGIQFNDEVGLTSSQATLYGGTGTWSHLQLITPSRFRTPVGGSPVPAASNGIQGLDGGFPYGGKFSADGKVPPVPDDDGPGTPLQDPSPSAGYQDYKIAGEGYTTYIMYTPPGANSTAVPIAFYNWSWNVEVQIAPTASWTSLDGVTTNGTILPGAAGAIVTFPKWAQIASPSWK